MTLDGHALSLLRALIRDVPDFPKPGIVFKDICPLLADARAFQTVIRALAGEARGAELVAGIEARGFLFASALALELGAGLIPLRKPGKLPGLTDSVRYGLEYGQDELHLHREPQLSGRRVLLVDDVLATGGTLAAAATLLSRSGASITGLAVVLELRALAGRSRLPAELPMFALLSA